MYVCLCKGITDTQIRAAVDAGASLRDIRKSLGVMTQCGKCSCLTREVVRDAMRDQAADDRQFYAVA